MAAKSSCWNNRQFSNKCSDLSQQMKRRFMGNIETNKALEAVKKLLALGQKMSGNSLWMQMNIIHHVIYKHQNQHRKEKYFQGMKRIEKHLCRLQAMKLNKLVLNVLSQFPKTKKGQFVKGCVLTYPSRQMTEHLMLCLMGAARLILQIFIRCQCVFHVIGLVCGQLQLGVFVTLHMVFCASLSRVWVLLKDFWNQVCDCYDVLLFWRSLLPSDQAGYDQESFPENLQKWAATNTDEELVIMTLSQNSSVNKVTKRPKSSLDASYLDRLFLPTTQENCHTIEKTPHEITLDLNSPRYNNDPKTKDNFTTQQLDSEEDLGEVVDGSFEGSFITEETLNKTKNKLSHLGEQVERDREQVFVEPKTKKPRICTKSIEYSHENFDTRVGKTYGKKRMLGLWKLKSRRKLVNSKMWSLCLLHVKKRKRSRAFVKRTYFRKCFPEVGVEEASIKLKKKRTNIKNRSGAATVTKSCCREHRGMHQFSRFKKQTGKNEETKLNKSAEDKWSVGHISSKHATLAGESRENKILSGKRKKHNWRLSEIFQSEDISHKKPRKKLKTGSGRGKNVITLEKEPAINQKEAKENRIAFRAKSALYKQYDEEKCVRDREQVFVKPKTKKPRICTKSIEYSHENFDTRVGKTYGKKRTSGLWKLKSRRKLVNSKMWSLYLLHVKKRKKSRTFVKRTYFRKCFPEVGVEKASIKLKKKRTDIKNRAGAATVTKSCCREHNRGMRQFSRFKKQTGNNEETKLNKSAEDKRSVGHISKHAAYRVNLAKMKFCQESEKNITGGYQKYFNLMVFRTKKLGRN